MVGGLNPAGQPCGVRPHAALPGACPFCVPSLYADVLPDPVTPLPDLVKNPLPEVCLRANGDRCGPPPRGVHACGPQWSPESAQWSPHSGGAHRADTAHTHAPASLVTCPQPPSPPKPAAAHRCLRWRTACSGHCACASPRSGPPPSKRWAHACSSKQRWALPRRRVLLGGRAATSAMLSPPMALCYEYAACSLSPISCLLLEHLQLAPPALLCAVTQPVGHPAAAQPHPPAHARTPVAGYEQRLGGPQAPAVDPPRAAHGGCPTPTQWWASLLRPLHAILRTRAVRAAHAVPLQSRPRCLSLRGPSFAPPLLHATSRVCVLICVFACVCLRACVCAHVGGCARVRVCAYACVLGVK